MISLQKYILLTLDSKKALVLPGDKKKSTGHIHVPSFRTKGKFSFNHQGQQSPTS